MSIEGTATSDDEDTHDTATPAGDTTVDSTDDTAVEEAAERAAEKARRKARRKAERRGAKKARPEPDAGPRPPLARRILTALDAPRRSALRRAGTLSRRGRRTVLAILAVVVVLAVAGVTVLGVMSRQDPRPGDVAAALDAARVRTAQVLSVDARTIDADTARGREALTGPFAVQYDQVVLPLINTYGRQFGTTIRTDVEQAGVTGVRTDDAGTHVDTLLFTQQTIASGGAPQRTAPAQLAVTVSEAGGQWLISDLHTV